MIRSDCTDNLKERNKRYQKVVKALEESCLLTEGFSKATENKAKEEKSEFLGILLGTLGAILLGNMLSGKGLIRAGDGSIRAG